MKRDNVQEYVHPTQKPVELICHALSNSTKTDDIVVDFFGGSGSTLIACEKSGRIARLIELDPKYCDTIVQRYVNYTDSESVIKNGQPDIWIVQK
jgi:DNA modification methylase